MDGSKSNSRMSRGQFSPSPDPRSDLIPDIISADLEPEGLAAR